MQDHKLAQGETSWRRVAYVLSIYIQYLKLLFGSKIHRKGNVSQQWIAVALVTIRVLGRLLIALGLTGGIPVFADDRTLTILAPDLPGSSEVGGIGRDAELVSATLLECGYKTKFIVQPFGRHMLSYRQSRLGDGVMTVPLSRYLPGHSTFAYIWYQHGAYYDRSRLAPIRTVADLKGLDVVTFKDGVKILGLNAAEVAELGEVHEKANPILHSKLLRVGRVDVILGDGLVIAEINHRLGSSPEQIPKGLSKLEDLTFAPIFNPTPYKMVFREAGLAKAFERCFFSNLSAR